MDGGGAGRAGSQEAEGDPKVPSWYGDTGSMALRNPGVRSARSTNPSRAGGGRRTGGGQLGRWAQVPGPPRPLTSTTRLAGVPPAVTIHLKKKKKILIWSFSASSQARMKGDRRGRPPLLLECVGDCPSGFRPGSPAGPSKEGRRRAGIPTSTHGPGLPPGASEARDSSYAPPTPRGSATFSWPLPGK